MRISCTLLALPVLLGLLPGCSKDKTPAPPTHVHVPGTPHTDEVLMAFRKAGLVPDGFAEMKPVPAPATYCERGKVNGVETMVCEYQDDLALDKGVQLIKEGWARVDTHTGVVVRAKRTLLAVEDRERREPSGKTISQMLNIFNTL
jgi:hypothetical protein